MPRARKLHGCYNDLMKVIFYYSSMSEEKVIQETLKDWQFIIENNYEYWMPNGVNPDSSINNIRTAIKNELILENINKVKASFEESLKENIFHLKNFADQVGLSLPHQIFVTLTQYGTGGSYELPNQVFINIRSNYGSPFSAFVHELVHLLIEKPVVERYRLSHQQLNKWFPGK